MTILCKDICNQIVCASCIIIFIFADRSPMNRGITWSISSNRHVEIICSRHGATQGKSFTVIRDSGLNRGGVGKENVRDTRKRREWSRFTGRRDATCEHVSIEFHRDWTFVGWYWKKVTRKWNAIFFFLFFFFFANTIIMM